MRNQTLAAASLAGTSGLGLTVTCSVVPQDQGNQVVQSHQLAEPQELRLRPLITQESGKDVKQTPSCGPGEEVLQTRVGRGAGRGLHPPLECARSSQSLAFEWKGERKGKICELSLKNVLNLVRVHGQRQ